MTAGPHPPPSLSAVGVARLRMQGQCLEPRSAGRAVAEVVGAVAGLQAQDPVGVELSLRARTTLLTRGDVETARVHERSVVRTWLMRGTLHLVRTDDLAWLRPLISLPMLAATAPRRRTLGLDDATARRAATLIGRALANGPLTRPELSQHLAAGGVDTGGQRIAYIVHRAALEGLICYGPFRGGRPTLVLTADWVRLERPLARDRALAELARRYLAAFAPAGPRDLAMWSGLSMRDATTAFGAIATELTELETAAGPLWAPRKTIAALGAASDGSDLAGPIVRLLGAFDTLLLGYGDRSALLSPAHARRVNAGGGMVRPALLVEGRVAGTWRRRDPSGVEIDVDAFSTLSRRVAAALAAELTDVRRFLATERGSR